MTPTLLPCGDQALTFQLGETVDPRLNARIIALADDLGRDPVAGVTEIVPTYRSLLLRYDPLVIRGAALGEVLMARFAALPEAAGAGRLWHVPAVYGDAVGQDLGDLAQMKGMSPEALIALHAAAEYRIYMIGFAPGFAYLGGLPEALHTPRLPAPRQLIPAGAIGIGGQQANINSVAGPSGWRFIAWTPVRLFDPDRDPAFLMRAGDRVRFVPVSADAGAALDARAATGDPLIAPEAGV